MTSRHSHAQPTPKRRRTAVTIAGCGVSVALAATVLAVAGGAGATAESAKQHGLGAGLVAQDRSLTSADSQQSNGLHRGHDTTLATGTASPSTSETATASASATSTPSASSTETASSPSPSPSSSPDTQAPLAAAVGYGTTAQPFASTSPWNTPIPADAPLDPSSGAIASHVLNNPNLVVNLDLYSFGIPFYTATASTPRVVLGGPNPGTPVPMDPSWKPNSGGDHKINVFDPAAGLVYEIDGYDPGSRSAIWFTWQSYVTGLGDGSTNSAGWKSPTGAAMSQAGGIIRVSDIQQGSIDHALSFITSNPTSNTFRYPASKTDGWYGGTDGVQEGMRIQLDPALNVDAIAGITPGEKMIAKALQRYGAYCIDNGGNNDQAMGLYAEQPTAGQADPYAAAGFSGDWAKLPHIPRSALRVVAASATTSPN